jgi:putative ABC transport system permease protein
MNPFAAREGVAIALGSLRSNKVRAALTILGIVIGVATVMLMAAVIGGIRSSISGQLEALGPKNFILMRFDQTQLQFGESEDGRAPWDGKPPITREEATLLASLPSIQSASLAVDASADLRYGSKSSSGVAVAGRDATWVQYMKGDFVEGRNFLPSDDERSTAVAVVSDKLARSIFGEESAAGKEVWLGTDRFLIVGVYRQEQNLFSGMQPNWAVVPPTTAIKRLRANRDWAQVLVVPTESATQELAIDEVTAALRTVRGLRPADENNFALVRQEAFMEMFDRFTGVFFIVMLVLSSIGLMVGGVGVVAIMMISVTERTREIGVRKALGATRREILWQFLVEAMTVTVVGGMIGMLLGGGGALLLSTLTPIPAAVPLWSIAAAIGISAVCGIGFGLYPANKAARLDPVEALRYE